MVVTAPPTLRESSIRLLQGLLRCDTQSPPGNEIRAAEYIRGALAEAGIDCTFVESAPGRVSVVARLNAAQPEGKPVAMMGHIDVVPVERDKWDRDPFSGDIVDGFVWGRGACDMKGQIAAELAAFIAIYQSGIELKRDLVFIGFADEEEGGAFGARYVWKNHRDLIDVEFAINEGGGGPMMIGDRLFFTCQVGLKGKCPLRMTVRGEPGHASMPKTDTAMEKLGLALQRLHEWSPATIITKTVRLKLETMQQALGGESAQKIEAIPESGELSLEDARSLPLTSVDQVALWATTHNTIRPTIVHGGDVLNVIPSEITVDMDTRLLPGVDPEAFRQEIQDAVGDLAEIRFLSEMQDAGIEADPASPFFDAIQETMAELHPGASIIPEMTFASTDAINLPGIKVYGFFPIPPSDRLPLYQGLAHGHNERLHVDDLGFGAEFYYHLAARMCS